MEDAQPPQKKLNVMTDAKDADINELAMTDLFAKSEGPGGCLRSLFSGEV